MITITLILLMSSIPCRHFYYLVYVADFRGDLIERSSTILHRSETSSPVLSEKPLLFWQRRVDVL